MDAPLSSLSLEEVLPEDIFRARVQAIVDDEGWVVNSDLPDGSRLESRTIDGLNFRRVVHESIPLRVHETLEFLKQPLLYKDAALRMEQADQAAGISSKGSEPDSSYTHHAQETHGDILLILTESPQMLVSDREIIIARRWNLLDSTPDLPGFEFCEYSFDSDSSLIPTRRKHVRGNSHRVVVVQQLEPASDELSASEPEPTNCRVIYGTYLSFGGWFPGVF